MKRQWFLLGFLLIASMICLMLGMIFGSKSLSLESFNLYLQGRAPTYETLVFDVRWPRTLAALVCGAALGLSGALMQGLTRNPLADPGLLGVNAGAAAAVVASVFLPSVMIADLWFALPGALLIATIVCVLGMGDDRDDLTRLILVGAAISASLYAFIQMVTQWYPTIFDHYRFWSSGSLTNTSSDQLYMLVPVMIIVSLFALLLGKFMNVLALGKSTAQSLGVNIIWVQAIILLVVSILSASTVALIGPVSFIGLGAAHIARFLVGQDYRFVLPASLLMGGLLLVMADILARVIIAPSEVATGIVTALLGAPLLYCLMMKKRR